MDPLIVGGGLYAGGALVNAFTAGQSKSLTREGWRLQVAENEKNRQYMSNEWDREFDKQNAYNAPSAQVERLLDAGINPSQVFGNGTNTTAMAQGSPSAGAGSSIPISAPLPPNFAGTGFISGIADAVRAFSEAEKNAELTPVEKENKETLTKQLAAQTGKLVAEKESVELENELTRIFGKSLKDKEVQQLDVNIRRTIADAEVLVETKDKVKADKALADAERLLTDAKRHLTDAQYDELYTLLHPRLMKLQAETRNLEAQSGYYGAMSSYYGAQEQAQRSINQMLSIDAENKFATSHEELLSRLDELETTHYIKQEVIERLRNAIKNNQYFEFREWMNALKQASEVIGNVGSAAANIGGHHSYVNTDSRSQSTNVNYNHSYRYGK